MKTSELTGAQLDWAVAKCEGVDVFIDTELYGCPRLLDKRIEEWVICPDDCVFDPSTDWSLGGPIIEREDIATRKYGDFPETRWQADDWQFRFVNPKASGPTPLIAAMRCYVASKMGDEINLPEELS